MATVRIRRDELLQVMEAAARIAHRTNTTFVLHEDRIEFEDAQPGDTPSSSRDESFCDPSLNNSTSIRGGERV